MKILKCLTSVPCVNKEFVGHSFGFSGLSIKYFTHRLRRTLLKKGFKRKGLGQASCKVDPEEEGGAEETQPFEGSHIVDDGGWLLRNRGKKPKIRGKAYVFSV